jgi:hypothetical protein
MTPFRLLVTLLVCLATGTLSAQTIADLEKGLRNRETLIRGGFVQVSSAEGYSAGIENFEFSASEGSFRTQLEARLRNLTLLPSLYENSEYTISGFAFGRLQGVPFGLSRPQVLSFSSKSFRLVKTGTGWTLPDEAYDLEFTRSGGIMMNAPTVTDFVIRAQRGEKSYVFSTVGSGRNDFTVVPGSTCELSTIQGFLRELQILEVDWKFLDIDYWDKVEFTLFEGATATTVVLTPPAPPKVHLAIQRDGSELVLVLSGEDAGNADIEEGPSLFGPWGPSLSLLKPRRPSTLTVGEYYFPIQPDGPVRFYRPRVITSPPVQ